MVGRTGAARLALTTGAAVIPIAHWGAQDILPYGSKKLRLFPRKAVRMAAGPPVDLSAYAGQRLGASVLLGDRGGLPASTPVAHVCRVAGVADPALAALPVARGAVLGDLASHRTPPFLHPLSRRAASSGSIRAISRAGRATHRCRSHACEAPHRAPLWGEKKRFMARSPAFALPKKREHFRTDREEASHVTAAADDDQHPAGRSPRCSRSEPAPGSAGRSDAHHQAERGGDAGSDPTDGCAADRRRSARPSRRRTCTAPPGSRTPAGTAA